MELNFDIDLVYLWCDGSDPEFQKKKQAAQKVFADNALDKEGTSNFRFVETEELKYSLRSVEKFAPWVRNIYIVTYEQVPKWLNTNHPKINIIDHKDIIPEQYLPTFNSVAIEVFLPHIPGLSEHFLFANDDMFFWSYTDKDFFFNNEGAPICRVLKRKALKVHSLYSTSINNGHDLILEKFGKDLMYWPHHGIDSYRKTDFLECLDYFKEEFERTASHKFREMSDVQRMTTSFYSIAQKGATVIEYHKKWYELFLRKMPENVCVSCIKRKLKHLKNKEFKLLCINDCKNTTDKDRLYMKEFLEEKFPKKSAYEL